MVQHMTGCTREEANRALLMNETVVDAIAVLTPMNPVTSGAKYIPAKPTIDTGMDPEQIALCARGRWLQDKVNAVVSVAHSKTLPDLSAAPASVPPAAAAVVPVAAGGSGSSPDSRGQTAQLVPQYELLQ